jgi:REP element-mobilizing transposase RayT
MGMSSTYLDLHYHLVFSTKHRLKQIQPEWKSSLHRYMGGTTRGLGGFALNINGTVDHVHLLVSLRATHCLADYLRELKKSSSSFVRRDIGDKRFAWQEGYSAFTVSSGLRTTVNRYIERQEMHHQSRSFRDELIALLCEAGIACDPKYLL